MEKTDDTILVQHAAEDPCLMHLGICHVRRSALLGLDRNAVSVCVWPMSVQVVLHGLLDIDGNLHRLPYIE